MSVQSDHRHPKRLHGLNHMKEAIREPDRWVAQNAAGARQATPNGLNTNRTLIRGLFFVVELSLSLFLESTVD
ncbi:hypothetical protein SAMD00023353_2100930 [Rosellinia necatrix]|uniref:Uncharacterized protein n=1 Tax=Rosellinia necatrix TaxID=77044 RepID=A0A1S8A8R6_ROSNE|nr:hypothetical protein SAMD00023353_2100930 [Rosellinia necatrix]